MIKSIRLLNWRSHSDTKLEFRQGTNLLVGIMGAGKSSVLEGISFALFGTFPALERRKLKLDNVVRLNEPKATIILEFEWDNHLYRSERSIERSKKGTSSKAELYRDNFLIEHGPVAVTSAISSLMALDYDLFTRAIYAEQNNLDYFLTLDPGRRKEEVDALLGLDKFETARANIVTVIHRTKSKRQVLEERFSKERVMELEAKEKTQTSVQAQAEILLKEASLAYETQARLAQSLSSRLEAMRKTREQFERLDKEAVRLSAQQESLIKELEGQAVDEASLKELETKLKSLAEERSKLNSSMKSAEEQASTISKESGSIEAKLRAASEASAKLATTRAELTSLLANQTMETLSKQQKDAEQSLISLESERKSIERELTELNEAMQRLKPGLSECPLCSAKLTEDGISHVKSEKESATKTKKARVAEISGLLITSKRANEDLATRTRKVSILSEKTTGLEVEAKAAEGLQPRKAVLEAEIAKAWVAREDIRKKADALSDTIERLKVEASTVRSLVGKKAELAAISKRLAITKEQLAQTKFDEKAFEELRSAAEKSGLEAERALSSKRASEAQLKSSSDILKLVREELTTIRALENDIVDLAKLEEQLSIYRNALLETQANLRLSLAEAINTAMNEIWGMFYPYRNYHSLRLGVSEKDYIFEVNDGSAWKGLETVASGGERASAALALRIALAMVLTPRLSWLILDEPTHNLDSEAVEMLSLALQSKVPEVVKQTFVITHDEAFMGSDFAASYRLTRDKERNGETKIESA
ncbi:SMC family ATPase [Candidatus Micrarchaeota archaeon]|nr:SMC family ATPase [Candidatus Micrarchaeota archaeon]